MRHPLQGGGETILVRFEVPKELRQLFEDTPTIFSRARFADGSIEGSRLHETYTPMCLGPAYLPAADLQPVIKL